MITSSSVNAQYPVSNLKESLATKKTRSVGNVHTIDFDFVSSVNVDSFLFNSIDWETVKIEGNSTANFSAPDYSITLSPDLGNLEYNFLQKEITTEKYRFWRLTFTNSVGASYCDVGKVFIGEKLQVVNEDMNLGWVFEQKDFSKIKTNYQGQRFGDIVPKKQKKVKGSYKYVTISNMRIIQRLGDEHSKVYPLWVVFDDTETVVTDLERNAMYCYMEMIPREKNSRPSLYDFSISLLECL